MQGELAKKLASCAGCLQAAADVHAVSLHPELLKGMLALGLY